MAKNRAEDATDMDKQLDSAHDALEVAKRAVAESDKKLEEAHKREQNVVKGHKKDVSDEKEAPPAASGTLVQTNSEKKTVVQEETFGMKIKAFFKNYLGISF